MTPLDAFRTGLVAAVAAAAALAGAACGEDEDRAASVPPATPVQGSGCSPVSYGGEGRPDFLIATSTVLQGQFTDHGVQISQALKMVLDEREWRAGDYTVGLQICGETTASGDASSPEKCRRNARAFARNRSVIVVHGPLFSTCVREAAPILNRAPGGPMAQTLAGPTYLGLTRGGPGVERGEPERYFASGRRSLVRLLPPDDTMGAAGALFAQRQGARRVFVLDDNDPYGFAVAEAFELAAERLGLEVAGRAQWDAEASDYRELARRVRSTGADAVYLGGYVFSNGPQLIKDLREALGADAEILGPDGFNQLAPIIEGAGEAAEGFTPMIAVLPSRELPPDGRDFAARFEERFGARPCCFSVHTAQATHLMLDAIAESDGSRAEVLENLSEARVEGGYIGDFEFDRYGDTTLNTIGVYRIEDGDLVFETAITPPAELLARR
jgi:branched-chain amino acid transport system substrate-binding protein